MHGSLNTALDKIHCVNCEIVLIGNDIALDVA